MITQDQLNQESDARNSAWRYVLGLTIALALAALIDSPVQNALKIGVWSAGFLGLVFVYVWPFLIDSVSILIASAISLFHCLVVWLTYPNIPHQGYLVIGIIAVGEFMVCLVPIAWLDKRSEDKRAKQRGPGTDAI